METTLKKIRRFKIAYKSRRIIVDVIGYLFVLLYLYAAANKLIAFDDFQLQMSKSPIITDFAAILVWFVPALEVVIAMLLLMNRTVLPGLYAAFILMCLFTAYIVAILYFSDSVPCQCGGVIGQFSWLQHLVFNGVFIVLGVVGIVLEGEKVLLLYAQRRDELTL